MSVEIVSSNNPMAQQPSASAAASSGASVNSDTSLHPSVVSDLFDGDLGEDELNAIPTLPMMEPGALDSYDFEPDAPAGSSFLDHDDSHPATHIAFTASAIDGALAEFEFLSPLADDIHPTPVLPAVAPTAAAPAQAEAKATSAPTETSPSKASTKKRGSTSDAAASTKKTTKKRKVAIKPKAAPAKKSSKASEMAPALVSPTSSLSLSPAGGDKHPVALMPSLPSASSAFKKQPLLPKPTSVVSGSVTPSSSLSRTNSAQNSVSGMDDSAPNSPSNCKSMLVINFTDPVNISSEHIAMLTSEQGPAECAKAIITPPSGLDGRQRGNKQSMTQEERAKASRDRNREHARNTRLRKKAYVEELKRTLLALADQRDQHLAQQQDKAQQEAEQRNVRYRVLEEFMTLRGRGGNAQEDGHRWAAILVPGFTLRLPTIDASQNFKVQDKTFVGVDQVMHDASAFTHVLQSLGKAQLQYQCDRNSFLMDGNQAVLDWDATSVAAKDELSFHGNIKAQFDPASNQLVSVTLLFDSSCLTAGK